MSETNSNEKTLECYGDPISNGRAPDKRTHGPVEIEMMTHDGEMYWTCPECGWMLKEFMGVHVDDRNRQ